MTAPSDPKFSSVQYMDTAAAYNLWSEVYDTDGNFLQALDSIEMKNLLPRMLSAMTTPKPWNVVDLGCGTGRNTLLLLQYNDLEVTALDLSSKMLEVARKRTQEQLAKFPTNAKIELQTFNLLSDEPIPFRALGADAVISTLVLEHVPLTTYFATVRKMLKSGGYLLLTNMHSDMGQISQAGFVDPKTKTKIRPASYPHTTAATIEEAAKHGLELVGEMLERSVTEEMVSQLGPRGRKWIGIQVWFGGLFRVQ